MVPANRLDVNKTVRKRLGAKETFAMPDETRAITGMEIGGVTPIGLPAGASGWKNPSWGWTTLSRGRQPIPKLKVPPGIFLQIADCEIVAELARPRDYTAKPTPYLAQRHDATPQRHATPRPCSNIQNGRHGGSAVYGDDPDGLSGTGPMLAKPRWRGETLPCEVMVKFEDDEVGATIYRCAFNSRTGQAAISTASVLTTTAAGESVGNSQLDCRVDDMVLKPGDTGECRSDLQVITGRMAACRILMTGWA